MVIIILLMQQVLSEDRINMGSSYTSYTSYTSSTLGRRKLTRVFGFYVFTYTACVSKSGRSLSQPQERQGWDVPMPHFFRTTKIWNTMIFYPPLLQCLGLCVTRCRGVYVTRKCLTSWQHTFLQFRSYEVSSLYGSVTESVHRRFYGSLDLALDFGSAAKFRDLGLCLV